MAWCIWLTGLSGAGKTTCAHQLREALTTLGATPILNDGDELRQLSGNQDFTRDGREANVAFISGSIAGMLGVGRNVIAAFISPYTELRADARSRIENFGQFIEVYINTPLKVCEIRDAKGLYKKARAGEISNFTGISDPYDVPKNPEITLDYRDTPTEWALQIIRYIVEHQEESNDNA
jgi:adenylyl-sulfate kinase